MSAATHCTCASLFPQFVDERIGHVRTMDCRILPKPYCFLLARGLNYRPRLNTNGIELLRNCTVWADTVLQKVRGFRGRATQVDSVRESFRKAIRQLIRAQTGADLQQLSRAAAPVLKHLVVFSTDKTPNNPQIECIHHYRLVCLIRLGSTAFTRDCLPDDIMNTISRFTPWAIENTFSPAILFATGKEHKREADPMAYRYITSACSDYSKPLSDEVVRVLTFLWGVADKLCTEIYHCTGAKPFWAVSSLDTTPLNIDTQTHRPNMHPGAFDLDKCFESIEIHGSEHSLLCKVGEFLDLTWKDSQFLCSTLRTDCPPHRECVWSKGRTDWCYSKTEVHTLVATAVNMAYITVGTYTGKQALGIPMGHSSSVILLNIYLFMYEYQWVMKLIDCRPLVAEQTFEIFRYVDDLGNFSDIDLSLYLHPTVTDADSCDWIYPLQPFGPLAITSQVEVTQQGCTFIYLNLDCVFSDGWLSFSWFDKASKFKNLGTAVYTHWSSCISRGCKVGTISSQVRSVMIAASSADICRSNICRLAIKFASIGYRTETISECIQSALKQHYPRLPLPYSL